MAEKPATLTQTLARNLVRLRTERGRSQRALADDMRRIGHKWNDVTVSNVERGDRSLSVDELGALAVVLRVSPGKLLVPLSDIAVGPDVVIEKDLAAAWLEGFGALWRDAGRTSFDGDLAWEFFRRQGMVIDEPRQSTKGDE